MTNLDEYTDEEWEQLQSNAMMFDWIVINLLTDSQLDVVLPTGKSIRNTVRVHTLDDIKELLSQQ